MKHVLGQVVVRHFVMVKVKFTITIVLHIITQIFTVGKNTIE